VQPLIDTRAPIESNGTADLGGVLIYRFVIPAVGFIFVPPGSCPGRDFMPRA
jgi:hypothetical protein